MKLGNGWLYRLWLRLFDVRCSLCTRPLIEVPHIGRHCLACDFATCDKGDLTLMEGREPWRGDG